MRHDPSLPVLLSYKREVDIVRLTHTNITNHELREVLVGLWFRLERADRVDHIAALQHYLDDPSAFLSPIAAALKKWPGDAGTVDLAALAARGEKVRP